MTQQQVAQWRRCTLIKENAHLRMLCILKPW